MISLIGIFLFTVILSYKFKKSIVKVLPVSVALLMGMLFVFAMLRHLSWIDYWGGIIIVFTLVVAVSRRKVIKWERVQTYLLEPSFIAFITALVLICILEKGRIATNFDDLGCWALEVKTLFSLDGFSMPGCHTTIGYAHYMPGQMLFEWWFCHMYPYNFHEGLMFIGYYSYYIMILAPVFCMGTSKNKLIAVWKGFSVTIILMLLPSTVSTFEYARLSVEFLQSALIGIMIYTLYNSDSENTKSDIYCWISYSFMLVMLKDSSLFFICMIYIWAFILWLIKKQKSVINVKVLILGGVISAFTVFVWKTYVKLNMRGLAYPRADISGQLLLQFLKNPSGADEKTLGFMKAFFESTVTFPLHINYVVGLNLTVIGAIFLVSIVLYIFYSQKIYNWSKKEFLFTEGISILCSILYLFVILAMDMFYFREPQYLDSRITMAIISRYMEPLFLGFLLYILFTCLLKMSRKAWLVACFFIFVFADINYVKNNLIFYKSTYQYASYGMKTELSSRCNEFISAVNVMADEKGFGKVLYVCKDISAFDEREIRYMMAPTAIYFLGCSQCNLEDFQKQLQELCSTNNVDYIYFDHLESDYLEEANVSNNRLYTLSEFEDGLY